MGHLETAAGVAGLVKAMLVLQHREIPGSVHFSSPSPHIDFDKLKLRVPTDLEPFPETDGERLAGVNSFGFGGANAHVILAEPPPVPHADHTQLWDDRAWPVALSRQELIDAVVNRTELAMPPAVTLEMAKGFTLYMVKAVMSGRGDELIDLARTNLWR